MPGSSPTTAIDSGIMKSMNTSDIGFFCFVFVPYLRAVLLDLAYSDE